MWMSDVFNLQKYSFFKLTICALISPQTWKKCFAQGRMAQGGLAHKHLVTNEKWRVKGQQVSSTLVQSPQRLCSACLHTLLPPQPPASVWSHNTVTHGRVTQCGSLWNYRQALSEMSQACRHQCCVPLCAAHHREFMTDTSNIHFISPQHQPWPERPVRSLPPAPCAAFRWRLDLWPQCGTAKPSPRSPLWWTAAPWWQTPALCSLSRSRHRPPQMLGSPTGHTEDGYSSEHKSHFCRIKSHGIWD